ncbi:hypothetical protein, partial [Roseivivax sp. CAU 1761]
ATPPAPRADEPATGDDAAPLPGAAPDKPAPLTAERGDQGSAVRDFTQALRDRTIRATRD